VNAATHCPKILSIATLNCQCLSCLKVGTGVIFVISIYSIHVAIDILLGKMVNKRGGVRPSISISSVRNVPYAYER
jgi:hypothetical protein